VNRNIIEYKCISSESVAKLSRQVTDLVCSAYRGGAWEPLGGVEALVLPDSTVQLYQAMVLVGFDKA